MTGRRAEGVVGGLSFACLVLAGCASCEAPPSPGPAPVAPASATPSAIVAASSSAPAVVAPPAAPLVREGSALARAPRGDALYVADEDHQALRIVPLPFDPGSPGRAVSLPGRPAQVVALADRVLVTIRDPGLLLVLVPDAAAGLVESARVPLPLDAWGLAVTPDGRTALVTSAWTHQISGVDLGAARKRWSIDVGREPRGVVVRPDGAAAYVTHLVGSILTRVDDLSGAAPVARNVDLPPSPLRSPSGRTLDASLGWAAALSADGERLFVARHALGALGNLSWFGAASVDVLMTKNDAPLAPKHIGRLPFLRADHGQQGDEIKLPGGPLAPFTQPRALVYRKRTGTVLVAGEGDDRVVELEGIALDPTLAVLRTYPTGAGYDAVLPVATSGGAPAGIALSPDESVAWVLCRSTYDVAEISLDPYAPGAGFQPSPPKLVRLADDPLDAPAALGRRIFYNATDKVTSGGLACAGCHPEGRDDGHVWHEAKINTSEGVTVNFLGVSENAPDEDHVKGHPRRTPILAGRVKANGPYGWHAESETLEARIAASFSLHRWAAMPKHEPGNLAARSGPLGAFLRRGLVPPPRPERPLTPQEEAGRVLFRSEATQCAKCHVPETEYTDRTAYPLPKLPVSRDFDDEARAEFKVPSLLFVGGHGSLFHDGSFTSLEELVDRNADRMGKTNHLSREERAALVAFLGTL